MKNPLAQLTDRLPDRLSERLADLVPQRGSEAHDDQDQDLDGDLHRDWDDAGTDTDLAPVPEDVVDHGADHEADHEAEAPLVDPDQVEVRRNGALAAVLGSVAAVVALAYLVRALGSGSVVDWLVFVVIGAVAAAHAVAYRDARTPLLVADRTGIRLRLGRAWQGLPWEELEEVEHAPRRTLLRDGRLVAFPVDPDAVLAGLDPAARRQAAISERVHGAPFAVPLGFTTRVVGARDGLTAALLALAPDPELVVEVVDDHAEWSEDEPAVSTPVGADDVADLDLDDPREPGASEDTVERPRPVVVRAEADGDVEHTVVRPVLPTSTPSPLRQPVSAVRAEVTRATVHHDQDDREPATAAGALPGLPDGDQLRREATDYFSAARDDTGVWRSTTQVVAATAGPAVEPVIGPQLTRARQAIGLDVERLAERTRIRAHVIEAIEIDDFEPCGGDFYARGHLRTLARVLGIDAAPLLATYDETYADAPIDPRRVFEAELATGSGGAIRSLRGGPNWSVLVAGVMAVVLAWSVARLVMDRPDPSSDAPSLSGDSAGLTSGETALAPRVPVVLTAQGGGAKVVVRDGAGTVVFKGDLAFGQSRTLKASPPVRVQTSDGSLTVSVDGADAKPMGRTGAAARNTFVAAVD